MPNIFLKKPNIMAEKKSEDSDSDVEIVEVKTGSHQAPRFPVVQVPPPNFVSYRQNFNLFGSRMSANISGLYPFKKQRLV